VDISWFGQSYFRIKGKTSTVVIDPYDPAITGLKLPKEVIADAVLQTHSHADHANVSSVSGDPIVVTGPGEYEVKGISVLGIQTYHDKVKGAERGLNTVYNVNFEGLNIVHLGDLGHLLSEEQIREIGVTDILMIPVGGTYTIDAKLAAEVVNQLEPKIILPMHYGGVPDLKIELAPLTDFLKEMGKEVSEPVAKLTISKDKLSDEPQIVVLQKS